VCGFPQRRQFPRAFRFFLFCSFFLSFRLSIVFHRKNSRQERLGIAFSEVGHLPIDILLLSSALVFVSFAVGRQVQSTLTIDQVMTPQELKETGVNTLSPTQRKALDAWLNRFTSRILRAKTEQGEPGRYAGLGSGHWISEVSNNGAYITLEDGSIRKQ